MTVDAGDRHLVAAGRRTTRAGRLYGLATIFGKTVRDSRRAVIVVIALMVGVMVLAGAATATAFKTVESRREAAALAATLPTIFQGLLGRQVRLETIGGLIEWRYPIVFFILAPIWSILALSGTLMLEAQQGSMEFLATTPVSRRRIAAEKLFAHLAMVVLVVLATALAAWAVGAAFATLPGDAIPPGSAVGFAVLVGVMIVAPGAVAFALAPFLGRGAAAGIAGAVMFAMFLVNGYRTSLPLFDTLSPLSWYAWTANHVPLGGQYDWPSLIPVVGLTVVLLAIGTVAFERRDLNSTIAVRTPRLPGFLLGLRGPADRAFGDRLPTAVAWGLGLGIYGMVIATTGDSLAETVKKAPVIDQMIRAIFPHLDYTSPGGVLQLAFIQFAVVVLGFAAATLVGGWASDESTGRLEFVLSAPVARFGWAIGSGLGTLAAALVMVAVIALGIAIGGALVGGNIVTPTIGMIAVAAYVAALAGIGICVGGLIRPSLAAPVVAAVTVATFLIGLFASALNLPDWVGELVLSSHLGQSMIGIWDAPGLIAFMVLAIGGTVLGAWGLTRRDLRD
jgi:ABC-2 type transport system permease protein